MLTTLTFAHFPAARLGTALRAFLTGILALQVKNVFRALKNRRDAAFLAEFDDRMLADIGLTRSDIRDASAEPLWRDPTMLLSDRAGERRQYRRGAPFGLSDLGFVAPTIVPEFGQGLPAASHPAPYRVLPSI